MKKYYFMIVPALLIIMATQSFAQNHDILTKKNDLSSNDYYYGSEKNPANAMVYSMILPGLGQLYNEKMEDGFWYCTFSIASLTTFGLSKNEDVRNGAAIVYGVNWLISIISAPVQANSINKEIRRKKAKLRENGYYIGLYNKDNAVGLSLTYNF